jgi:hypothetical protein
MKTTPKKPIFYDETNIPGGSCMSGKFMTAAEEKMVVEWVVKAKAKHKIKQEKGILQKTLSYYF